MRPPAIPLRSGRDSVVEVHHAAAEAVLVDELEIHADIVGQSRRAASDHDGVEKEVDLIDQSGLHHLPGKV